MFCYFGLDRENKAFGYALTSTLNLLKTNIHRKLQWSNEPVKSMNLSNELAVAVSYGAMSRYA